MKFSNEILKRTGRPSTTFPRQSSPLRRRLEALLPAEVAVEDDLVGDPAALRGAFALYARVDLLTQFDAPAQPDTVIASSGRRYPAGRTPPVPAIAPAA